MGLLLCLPTAASPLEEGWQALNSGDWKEAGRLFEKVDGLEGRLALARVDLILGRTENALGRLKGQSSPELVTRVEVLYDAGLYTKATQELRELEQREHSAFSPPYDFRFYKTRGGLEKVASNFELAHKNLTEAARRATTPDQRALVLAKRTWLWLDQGEMKKASSSYDQLEALLPETRSVWTVAQVLDAGFALNRRKGNHSNAHALKRAEREIYLARGNQVRAASTLINVRNIASFKHNDPDRDLDLTMQAVAEFLDAKDWMRAAYYLGDLSYVYRLAARVPEIEKFVNEAVSRFPEGRWRDRARISQAYCFFAQGAPASTVKEAFTELTRSRFPAVRAQAYHGLARQARKLGNYQVALRSLEQSLALAAPQSKEDRDWSLSPGYALVEMSRLENRRQQYQNALKLARQAASIQNGKDWAWWRVDARQQGLTAALGMHDLEAAEDEFRGALKDIKSIPLVWFRSVALGQMIGSLLINRSLDEGILEPTDLLFEEYDDVVHGLIQSVYSDPEELSYLLDTLDTWKEEAKRRKLVQISGRPSIRKGLILETLGRRAQARECFKNGLKSARENGVPRPQVLANIFLARLAAQEGRIHDSADHATKASQIARSKNEQTGKPYALIAGGAQLEAGRYIEALESFEYAIAQNLEKAWAGHFGRALTQEKMNRFQGALSDIDSTLELIEKSDLAAARAKALGTKARLLSRLGRHTEALELFAQSFAQHKGMGAARYLPQLAMDYSHSLRKLSRDREALEVLTGAVDQLVDWQTPNFKNSRRLFERTVALALELGDNKAALRYLQMSRSAEVLDSVNLATIETDPDTQALLKDVKGLKLRLNKLREKTSQGKESDSLGRLLAATREDFFAKLAKLRSKDPDFEALVSVSGSQLTSLQELLPKRSVLLEYFPAKNKLYIFAVSRDDFRMHEVSLSRSDLESLSRQHLEGLKEPGQESQELKESAQRLRRVLLDPIELDQFDSLRVVPSGPIWRVPLGTLLDEQDQALHQRFEISYLTSSDIVHIFGNHSAASLPPQNSVWWVGPHGSRGLPTR